MNFNKITSFVKFFILVMGSTALSIIVIVLANRYLGGGPPLLWFIPSILFSSFIFGFKAGMLSTIVSTMISVYYFLPPNSSFEVASKNDILRLVIFFFVGISLSLIIESKHRNTKKLSKSLNEIEDVCQRLVIEVEERKLAEIKLKLKENELNHILSSIPAAVVYIDAKETYRYCNSTFAQWLEKPIDDIIGKSVQDILSPDYYSKLSNHYEDVLNGERASFDEYLELNGKGKHVHIEMVPELSWDKKVIGRIVLKYDISDRIEIEQKLEKANLEAQVANQMKSDFLATMSHEIRTPLGVMLGYADLLSSNKMSNEVQKYAESIRKNGLHLLSIINDVLDLSKVESGKIDIEKRYFLLKPFINELISNFQYKANQKGLKISVEFSPIPEAVCTDEVRLRQVLTNLLANAIKFTSKGEIKIKVTHIVDKNENGDKKNILSFDVIDTGIGIELENLNKIFEPFTQAETYINREFGGTGLGLNLSKKFAQHLGGDLFLKSSQKGLGSTFTLLIDAGNVITKNSLIELKQEHANSQSSFSSMSPMNELKDLKILLVEDFVDNQIMIKALLTHHGAEVDIAVNGEEGVRKALAGFYDIVLMDIQMPVLNGYQAVIKLRQEGYGGPIIALTAEAMNYELERCLQAGFDDYIPKPIHRMDLISLIEKYNVHNRRINQELQSENLLVNKSPLISTLVNDEIVGALVPQFIKDLPSRMDQLKAFIKANSINEIKSLAHQLAGAGGSYGFPEVTELSRHIEMEVKKNDPEISNIIKYFNELESLSERILMGIEN